MRCHQLPTGVTGEDITHWWRLKCNMLDNLQQQIGLWVPRATVPTRDTGHTVGFGIGAQDTLMVMVWGINLCWAKSVA